MGGAPHHHYGVCDELKAFEWMPNGCSLHSRNKMAAAACRKLRERRIVFVGDSVVEQLFFSFTMLMQGNFSASDTIWTEHRRFRRATQKRLGPQRSLERVEVHGCGVRLQFVRSDLLIWSATREDIYDVFQIRNHPVLVDFRAAIVSADIVVLGTGHHFANAFEAPFYASIRKNGARDKFGAKGLRWETFFAGNLNRTLRRVIAARRAAGLAARESVIVVSPTRPVPRCWDHVEPIDVAARREGQDLGTRLRAVLLSDAKDLRRASQCKNWRALDTGTACSNRSDAAYLSAQWNGWSTYRSVARQLAEAVGATFFDTYPLAALRPDAAIGRFMDKVAEGQQKSISDAFRDCVHFCLPGPPDEWSRILAGLLVESPELPWPPRLWSRVPALPRAEKDKHEFFHRSLWATHTTLGNHLPTPPAEENLGATYRWWPYQNNSRAMRLST